MNKMFFIIFVILVSGILIYLIIHNIRLQDIRNLKMDNLKKVNKLRENIINKNNIILTDNIKNSIYNFVVNRISHLNKLSSKDILKLKDNFIFITNQILIQLLKLYSIYEIEDIISNDPYDIYNNLLKAQSNNRELLLDQQIAGINFLKNKYPKIDSSKIVNYIKKYSNIFKIEKINIKNNNVEFSKDQIKILQKF